VLMYERVGWFSRMGDKYDEVRPPPMEDRDPSRVRVDFNKREVPTRIAEFWPGSTPDAKLSQA